MDSKLDPGITDSRGAVLSDNVRFNFDALFISGKAVSFFTTATTGEATGAGLTTS